MLADLPEPEVNVRIENDARYLGRPDLIYRKYRAFLEYEGDQHRHDRRQWASRLGAEWCCLFERVRRRTPDVSS